MSTFAINDPTPSWSTKLAISSTDTYDREHKTGSMPSLTLAPVGKDCDQSPLARVVALGDHSKAVDMERWQWVRPSKWTQHPALRELILKVFLNHFWVLPC